MAEIVDPTFWYRIGDRSVLVFDGLFPEAFVESFGMMVMGLNYRRKLGYNDQLHHDLGDELYGSLPLLPGAIAGIASHYKPALGSADVELKVFHVVATSLRHGEFTGGHQDCESPHSLTFLYYANLRWDAEWGGETLFYDRRWDARAAVTPRPGRLVVFHSSLNHRAGVPLRDSPHSRLTVSVFLREREFFLRHSVEAAPGAERGEDRWARLPSL